MGYIVRLMDGESIKLHNADGFYFENGFIHLEHGTFHIASFSSESVASLIKMGGSADQGLSEAQGGLTVSSGRVVVDKLEVREKLTVTGEMETTGATVKHGGITFHYSDRDAITFTNPNQMESNDRI